MVLPHPGGNERGQREPKQQMQIRPQDAARNMLRRLQEVMMVVPVDADVDETQDIAEENRKEWLQGRKTGSLWRLHFQHHDGDDDGEYPVTKSVHAALGHPSYSFFGLRVKREQPGYGPLPPNTHFLGFDAEFSQKTRACISGVDSSALCMKSRNAAVLPVKIPEQV